MRQKNIWYLDLFSGIGGFREGLTQAGGFTCAGHCEIDQHADRSYRALFDLSLIHICAADILSLCPAGRNAPDSCADRPAHADLPR